MTLPPPLTALNDLDAQLAGSGYAVLDFYVDDGKVASSVAYGQASDYSDVSEGSHTTSFSSSGGIIDPSA